MKRTPKKPSPKPPSPARLVKAALALHKHDDRYMSAAPDDLQTQAERWQRLDKLFAACDSYTRALARARGAK